MRFGQVDARVPALRCARLSGGTPRTKPKACPEGAEAHTAKAAPRQAPPPMPPAMPAPTTPPVSANGATNTLNAPNAPPSTLAPNALPVAPPVPVPVPAVAVDPTVITVEHWSRILDGELLATSSRVEWAGLLKRTFGFDAMRCPRCAARMRVMATLTEPSVVKKILSHLGVRTEPLPRARARDPTGQESFDDDATRRVGA